MAAVLAAQAAQATTTSPPLRTWRHMLTTRLARMSGAEISVACGGCDHTQASRIASGQRGVTVSEWCNLLEAMGYKLVNKGMHCVPADELAMLRRVYALHNKVDLEWGDPE